LLALAADQIAAGRRELVIEDDVMIFAVEAVGLDLLVDEARRDL